MPLHIISLLIAAPLAINVADTVPNYDLDVTCRRAAESAVTPGRTTEGCKNDEMGARTALEQQWTNFPLADRTRCGQTSRMGGPASYVDLLTCLDMAKTARALPKNELTVVPASR